MSSGSSNNNCSSSTKSNSEVAPESGKSPRREEDENEDNEEDAAAFEVVRSHLRSCPKVSADNPAVQAALRGLDEELARRQLDRRLRRAFVRAEKAAAESKTTATLTKEEPEDPDVILLDGDGEVEEGSRYDDASMGDSQPHDSAEDDWHHVPESHAADDDPAGSATCEVAPDSSSPSSSLSLGARIAKDAIAQVALFEVKVSTPLQAVIVALHAAMRGPYLGFACTGVPETVSSATGFAPPVRELPRTHFLPHDFFRGQNDPRKLELRYRRDSVGSLVLRVEVIAGPDGSNGDRIRVSVIPTSVSQEPSHPFLDFDADDYVNLSSFSRAMQTQMSTAATSFSSIPPALHYKSLSALIGRFVRTFDLAVDLSGDAAVEQPYVDVTVQRLPAHSSGNGNHPVAPADGNAAEPLPPLQAMDGRNSNHYYDPQAPPTLASAFPGAMRPARLPGNFDDDLNFLGGAPSMPFTGGLPPSPFVGGNLMGPNHPAFTAPGGPGGIVGGGMSGVGPHSGFGMRPRFDPYGPPGGPTEPFPSPPPAGGPPAGGRRPIMPPGGTGDPNPDHLAPPDAFHSNMFM